MLLYSDNIKQLKVIDSAIQEELTDATADVFNTPFYRQNYRSERDAEKRLGTNTTRKNLLYPPVVCVIWYQRLLPLVHFCPHLLSTLSTSQPRVN